MTKKGPGIAECGGPDETLSKWGLGFGSLILFSPVVKGLKAHDNSCNNNPTCIECCKEYKRGWFQCRKYTRDGIRARGRHWVFLWCNLCQTTTWFRFISFDLEKKFHVKSWDMGHGTWNYFLSLFSYGDVIQKVWLWIIKSYINYLHVKLCINCALQLFI